MKDRMDMLSGSLGNKIIKYAMPLAATGILQQLFNAADLAVVGQFSGKATATALLKIKRDSRKNRIKIRIYTNNLKKYLTVTTTTGIIKLL